MFCSNCGHKLSDNAKFCRNCGGSIKRDGTLPESKITEKSKPKFNFGKTYLISSGILAVVFLIFFWLADSFKDDAIDSFFGVIFLAALVGLLATFIIRAFRGEQKETISSSTPEDISKYKGLEGWLAFVGLGLIVMAGYGIYIFFDTIFSGAEYAGTFVYKYDLFNGAVMALFSGYVIYLYFFKKKSFKNFYIGLWIYMVLQAVGTYAVVSSFTSDSSALSEYTEVMGRNFFGALIWISYTLSSKRVKATFVND